MGFLDKIRRARRPTPILEFVASEDEAGPSHQGERKEAPSKQADPKQQEDLELPNMKHFHVAYYRRTAGFFFSLKSTAKLFFFTFLPLVLRHHGLTPTMAGIIRGGAVMVSLTLISCALSCIRGTPRRKRLAHMAMCLAAIAAINFTIIPQGTNIAPMKMNVTTAFCSVSSNKTVNDNGTESSTVTPHSAVSVTSHSTIFQSTATQAIEDPSAFSPTPPSSPQKIPTAAPPDIPYHETPLPQINQGPPHWVKDIISKTQIPRERRAVPNVFQPLAVGGIQDFAAAPATTIKGSSGPQVSLPQESTPLIPQNASDAIETTDVDKPSESNLTAQFFDAVNNATSTAGGYVKVTLDKLRHYFPTQINNYIILLIFGSVIICDFFIGLTDRISSRLYHDYLDQIEYTDKFTDHMAFSFGFSTLIFGVVATLLWRFGCIINQHFDMTTSFLHVFAIVFLLADLMFLFFPVPDKKPKNRINEGTAYENLSIWGNPRLLVLAITLSVLGATFAAEQNFLLWHLAELGGDFALLTTLAISPVLMSMFFIHAIPAKTPTTSFHRFIIFALISVNIRFVAYAFIPDYDNDNFPHATYLLIAFQVFTPLSTTVLWRAVDSFLEQTTIPGQHARVSSSMKFAHWGIGYFIGAILGGFGFEFYGFKVAFTAAAATAGSFAILFAFINRLVPLHEIDEKLHYAKLLVDDTTLANRPINRFDDESDEEVEYHLDMSKEKYRQPV